MWHKTSYRPRVSLHLYTPHVTITTNSSNRNILMGYVELGTNHTISIKDIRVAIEGQYNATFICNDLIDYHENKKFLYDQVKLNHKNIIEETTDWQIVNDPSEPSSLDINHTPPSVMDKEMEMQSGTCKWQFAFVLPNKIPPTIMSPSGGGIEYRLSVRIKTKYALGMSKYLRARRLVNLVNLPSRLAAEPQMTFPVNDEAVFTRQVKEKWWVMLKLPTRTVNPEEVLRVETCLAWPQVCGIGEGTDGVLETKTVEMEVIESAIYRTIESGTIIKRIKKTVASSLNTSNVQQTESTTTLVVNKEEDKDGEDMLAYNEKCSTSQHNISAQEQNVGVRGMFNESCSSHYSLRLPREKQHEKDKNVVHLTCKSTPLCISHELKVTVQVVQVETGELSEALFRCPVNVVPDFKAFFLPAYQDTQMDMLVI